MPKFKGDISSPSLASSNKIEIPSSVTANATKSELSGESDPGYESDGTKQKQLILQNKMDAMATGNMETKLNSPHSKKTDQYEDNMRSHASATNLDSKCEGHSQSNIISVGNTLTTVSLDPAQSPVDKKSFSKPVIIRHVSSMAHSSNTQRSEKFKDVSYQEKNSTYSNPKNWNSSSNISSLSGMSPKHSVLPQNFHLNEKYDNVRNITVSNTTVTNKKCYTNKGPSYSNVLVIPIESKDKLSLSTHNDEDIEVSSIFDDLIQSANDETSILVGDNTYYQSKKQQHVKHNHREEKDVRCGDEINLDKDFNSLRSSFELPTVTMKIFSPVLLEDDSLGTSKALHSALSKVDVTKLNNSYDLVLGLVKKKDISDAITSDEESNKFGTIKRNVQCDTYRSSQTEENLYDVKKKCLGLKRILTRIHIEIDDRKAFLEIIKEIASAIKKLLDSVNHVIRHAMDDQRGVSLEEKKKEFVRSSKRFSNTLKGYFRHGNPHFVISASSDLILQVNEIMITLIV